MNDSVLFVGYFSRWAERLENTLLGYLEFGQLAEKAALIKVLAGVLLILHVILLFIE